MPAESPRPPLWLALSLGAAAPLLLAAATLAAWLALFPAAPRGSPPGGSPAPAQPGPGPAPAPVTAGAGFEAEEKAVREWYAREAGGADKVRFVGFGPNRRLTADDAEVAGDNFGTVAAGDVILRVRYEVLARGEWRPGDTLCRLRRGRPVAGFQAVPNRFGDDWWHGLAR